MILTFPASISKTQNAYTYLSKCVADARSCVDLLIAHCKAIKRIPFAEATPEGGVPCNVIREISLLRELDHPNVVRLLDVNQAQPGELYLVFEYVAFDLKTYMDQQQTSTAVSERVGLRPSVVKNFMRQILQGVGFCHTYRVLHRDLKPHNVSLKIQRSL